MDKPILCIDFDGVIHSYEKGWQGGDIYGNHVPGFFAWADKAKDHFRLAIYSSRTKDGGTTPMREAIGKWSIDAVTSGELPADYDFAALFSALEFPVQKPPAFLTIDDRCLRFEGDWNEPRFSPENLAKFKPWMQL